jgi:hypothetical protein
MELGPLYNAINFSLTYSAPQNTTIAFTPVKFLFCPSDPGPPYDDNSIPFPQNTGYATMSYGVVVGDWYVFSQNGASLGPINRAAFGPSYSRNLANFQDGLSNSLLASEGYIGHLQARDCLKTPNAPSDSSAGTWTPNNVPTPQNSLQALNEVLQACSGSAKFPLGAGHTRWTNGGVYYSGITTAVPPNPRVSGKPNLKPFDWVSIDENNGGPTYASLAATGYHPGGVNTLLGDGGVRFIKDSINNVSWRALGTIAGGEVISADSF